MISQSELEEVFDSGMRYLSPSMNQPKFYLFGHSNMLREYVVNKPIKRASYITRISINQEFSNELFDCADDVTDSVLTLSTKHIPKLNDSILGTVEIIEGYYSKNYHGTISPKGSSLKGATAVEILRFLIRVYEYNMFDFSCTVKTNVKTLFCNFAYWTSLHESVFESEDLHTSINDVLQVIHLMFKEGYPSLSLPTMGMILDSELSE